MSGRCLTASAGMLLVAVASAAAQDDPPALTLEEGPKASIQVTYTGGLIDRRVTASFRVEKSAYVLVGHVGGDGMVRILYPETPRSSGYTPAKRTLRIGAFDARYDGAPSLYRFMADRYRSVGARMDSYDGRGHGFVFLVASRSRMDFGDISDGGEFSELEMAEGASLDPRVAVRALADQVTRGRYTLKYATSLTTVGYSGYAARAYDCALLATMASMGRPALWGYSPWGALHLGFGASRFGSTYCGDYAYSRRSYADYCHPIRVIAWTPVAAPPALPVTPTLTRPPQRVAQGSPFVGFSSRSVGLGSRSSFDRSPSRRAASPSWSPPRRTRSDAFGGFDTRRSANAGRSPGGFGGSRGAAISTPARSSAGSSPSSSAASRPAAPTSSAGSSTRKHQ